MSKTLNQQSSSELDNNTDTSFFIPNLRSSKSKSLKRSFGEAGVISVINSEKNGKRITLSKELLTKLKSPDKVQILFTDYEIVIGEKVRNGDNCFNINKYGNKGILYSYELVKEVTEVFGLDFSDKTSITYNNVRYVSEEGYPIAIIEIRKQ